MQHNIINVYIRKNKRTQNMINGLLPVLDEDRIDIPITETIYRIFDLFQNT